MMPAVRIEISIRKMSVLILQSPSRSGSLESTNLLTQSREREILIVILVGMQRRFRADDDDDDSATCARKPSHYWIGRKHVNNKVCCQYNWHGGVNGGKILNRDRDSRVAIEIDPSRTMCFYFVLCNHIWPADLWTHWMHGRASLYSPLVTILPRPSYSWQVVVPLEYVHFLRLKVICFVAKIFYSYIICCFYHLPCLSQVCIRVSCVYSWWQRSS